MDGGADWEQPGSFGGGSSDSAAAPNAKNWQAVLKDARGFSGGGVDMIWINGENFVPGRKAKLWLKGWARSLPNARYVPLVLG